MSGHLVPIRIAMWSGPRNISTAMMRAWGNRADTAVIDEPFYASYLKATGKKHPDSQAIMTHCETDVQKIIKNLIGPVPAARPIFYQKHMTHHLLPGIDRTWLRQVANCFLIREPDEVIASYINKSGVDPTLEDLGFVQQLEIFDHVRHQSGVTPPVVDATDVLQNPEKVMRVLCEAVGVEFDPAMLSWPPGLRETDGIWAKHWYPEVARSTGFQPYRERAHNVPKRLGRMSALCRQCYDQLYQHRLH